MVFNSYTLRIFNSERADSGGVYMMERWQLGCRMYIDACILYFPQTTWIYSKFRTYPSSLNWQLETSHAASTARKKAALSLPSRTLAIGVR